MSQNPSIKHDGISFNPDPAEIAEIKATYHPHVRAKGHYILVKPYVRPEQIDGVYISDGTRQEDGHHSVAAQVIDVGPTAYTDPKFSGGVSWVEIGDHVIIPRVAGIRVVRKIGKEEIMFRAVKEDDAVLLIKDPTEWEIRVSTTRF